MGSREIGLKSIHVSNVHLLARINGFGGYVGQWWVRLHVST